MKKWILVLLGMGFLACAFLYSYYRSPDYELCMGGNLFVVNKLDHSISIIDLANKEKIKTIDIGIEPHEALLSANKDILVVSDFGNEKKPASQLHLISTKTFKLLKTINLENKTKLHGLALTAEPDVILVTSEGSNSLLSLNLKTGEIESETKTLGTESHMVVSHPTKPVAYVSNIGTGNISIINYKKDSLIKTIYCGAGSEGLALSPKGDELWVCNKFEDSISIINTESLQMVEKLATGSKPVRLAISPDGLFCVSSNLVDGNLTIYNTKTRQLIKRVEFPGSKNIIDKFLNKNPTPTGLLFHPTKKILFIVNSNADSAEVLSTENWEIIGSWKVGDIPDGLALNVKPDDCP